MKFEKIEDFGVWKKAESFCDAVSAILTRPEFVKDFDLRGQVQSASDSVLSNMSEGFQQPTDRAFAKFLYVSKASTAEIGTRLGRAQKRGYLTRAELAVFQRQAAEVARMTTGLIKHLMKSPGRRRGLGPHNSSADDDKSPNDE
jgi:four helix bundle protein